MHGRTQTDEIVSEYASVSDDDQSHGGAAMVDVLAQRYEAVKDRIAIAAKKSGRRPEDIYLVAVTKNAEPEQIRRLIALGHRDFGENRVQQLIQRVAMVEEYFDRLRVLPSAVQAAKTKAELHAGRFGEDQRETGSTNEKIRWHMIGHLQRNKARKVVPLCRLVHSVDSLRLAEEIQQVALRCEEPVEVLVQVNCSEEPQKCGCPIAAAKTLAEQIGTMINVRVRGLMTLARQSDDPSVAQASFSRCREIFEDIRRSGAGDGRFNILSMGMSNDFEIAIQEGANIVRVGSAIFGQMPAPDQAHEESTR